MIYHGRIFFSFLLVLEILPLLQVEKILGPGNQYVTAAKMILQVISVYLLLELLHKFDPIKESCRNACPYSLFDSTFYTYILTEQ